MQTLDNSVMTTPHAHSYCAPATRSLIWDFDEHCEIVHGITPQPAHVFLIKCVLLTSSRISNSLAAILNGDFSILVWERVVGDKSREETVRFPVVARRPRKSWKDNIKDKPIP